MRYHQNGFVENDLISFPHTSGNSSKPPKSKTACKFFLAGKCSFGARCQFSHMIQGSAGINEEYCSFYRAGHCKYGSSCALKHDNPFTFPIDNNLVMLTSSMEDLDFQSEMTPRSSEGGRNSLLPSFLVDELLLDDDEDEEDHHISTNFQQFPRNSSLFSKIDEISEPIVFFERSSSVTPVNSKAPASYGEAISSGLNLKNGMSLGADSFVKSEFDDFESEHQQQLSHSKGVDELCAFSIMGKCRYGSFCRNVHGLQCPRCLLYVLHPSDMERNENHLNDCLSKPESVPIAQLHQIQCRLCLSPVLQGVDPRFGILNCNHAFCLGCIRNWRSTHFDANNEHSRSCPDCKEVTYFIVPSSTWIDDHVEKFKVIEQYKKRMSVIPCKYFDYGCGDCPFGTSCFYEHRVEVNADTKFPKAPLILDHREQIAKVRDAKLSDYIVFKTAPARNKKK